VQANSILSAAEAVSAGRGVGILPLFLAQGRRDLVQASEPLAENETQLFLLTHPEFRHLRRIAAVYAHLAQAIALD